MSARKRRYGLIALSIFTVAVAGLVYFWNWDWFIPLVQSRASAAAGRPVTIQHLHVALSRRPIIELQGVTVANPNGFPDGPPLATLDALRVQFDVPAYLNDRSIVIPFIALDHPVIEARAQPDGTNNYTVPSSGSGSSGSSPKIGDVRITDGHAHIVIPKLKSDFALQIATRSATAQQAPARDGAPSRDDGAAASGTGPTASSGSPSASAGTGGASPTSNQTGGGGPEASQLVVTADGTYAGQPITGQFVGGALLSLRDTSHPYPIDLKLANGATHVSLVGTVQDPLSFKGADLKLALAGADMSQLYPLTGVPIPQTPSYDISGNLDYESGHIRFHDFAGRLGSSDLEGNIDVDPGAAREKVTAKLASKRVDLADLGGFIGSTPGRKATPDQTAEQRTAIARAEASPRLIPDTPLNLPKIRAADVDLTYHAAHVEGRSVPFDRVDAALTIDDGKISVHPFALGVGRGEIAGNIALDGDKNVVHARANIDFKRLELSRLMAATHSFGGSGIIGGKAVIDGSGNSLAALLGSGNGEVKLFISNGGDVSALLVDLSGLELGNAVLSALGIPRRADLKCLITDFALERGVLRSRALLLDTSEADVFGHGDVNLRDETIDMVFRTEAKHFSIGSLPTDIDISGKLKSPSIGPDKKELGARAGAAVGLGVLLTPLGALIPTVQFGIGDDNACGPLLAQVQRPPSVNPAASRPAQAATPTRRAPVRARR